MFTHQAPAAQNKQAKSRRYKDEAEHKISHANKSHKQEEAAEGLFLNRFFWHQNLPNFWDNTSYRMFQKPFQSP